MRPFFATLALSASCFLNLAGAEKPVWHCLDEETVAVVNIPEATKCYETLQSTRLAQTVFTAKRMQSVMQLISKISEGESEKIEKKIADWGFTIKDLPLLGQGQMGAAVMLVEPNGLAAFWCEPGGDLADRLMKALDRLSEEQAKTPGFSRVDEKMSGYPVIQIEWKDAEKIEIEPITGDSELLTPQQQRVKKAPDHNIALIHRRGNRLIAVMGDKKDQEQGRSCLVKMLREMERPDSRAGFASLVASAPGALKDNPNAQNCIEIHVHPKVIWSHLAKKSETEKRNSKPAVMDVIRHLGVDTLGLCQLRVSLRPDGFLIAEGQAGMPSPRKGIPAIFDQNPIATQAPAWIPAEVLGYAAMSLDLSKVYGQVLEMVLNIAGPQAEQGFQQANAQTKTFTGSDIPTILKALGNRIHYLDFPLDPAKTKALDDNPLSMTRAAFVWELGDETVIKTVLTRLTPFMAMGSGVASTEQGFDGHRFSPGGKEVAAVFLGKGHLVLGIGEGAASQAITALAHPPTSGVHALQGSKMFKEALTTFTNANCIAWHCTDGNKMVKNLGDVLRSSIGTAMNQADLPEEVSAKEILDLIPSEDDLKDCLGVGADQVWMDKDGLHLFEALRLTMQSK